MRQGLIDAAIARLQSDCDQYSGRYGAARSGALLAELHRLREIERLARANYRASSCHDQVLMDEPECGTCAGCKLRAALEVGK